MLGCLLSFECGWVGWIWCAYDWVGWSTRVQWLGGV